MEVRNLGLLSNHIALVTGASRGIGKSIALALAADGADIAINYRKESAAAESVAAEIKKLGRRAIAVQADVSPNRAEFDRIFAEVETARRHSRQQRWHRPRYSPPRSPKPIGNGAAAELFISVGDGFAAADSFAVVDGDVSARLRQGRERWILPMPREAPVTSAI